MTSNQEADLWIILPEDRVKYEAQFLQLGPVNGMITGEKVKPILMKSGLSTAVLGHIWGLADINGDGKLDKKEFMIAVHLIRKKLQGTDLPKALPASLKADVPTDSGPVSQTTQKTQLTKTVTSPEEASEGAVASAFKPVAGAVVPNSASVSSPTVASVSTTVSTAASAVVSSPTSVPPPKSVAITTGAKPSPIASPPSSIDISVARPTVSVASQGGGPKGNGWAIPAGDLSRYQQLFNSKDQKKRGYLTGLRRNLSFH